MDTKSLAKFLFEVLFVVMIIQTNMIESRKLMVEELSSPLSAPAPESEDELEIELDESDIFCYTGTLDWISKDVCCPSHCVDPLSGESTCGGERCQTFGDESDCCTFKVRETERYCDEVGPPCVVRQPKFDNTTDITCSNGILDEKNEVCCMSQCRDDNGEPFCGGLGCGLSTLGESEGCCVTKIKETTRYCDEVGPPCIMRDQSSKSFSSKTKSWVDDNKEWFYPVVVISGSIVVTVVAVALFTFFKK